MNIEDENDNEDVMLIDSSRANITNTTTDTTTNNNPRQPSILLHHQQQLSKNDCLFQQLSQTISIYNNSFYPTLIRQNMHFPDRKLIQFDSGKLQTLAVLLYDLKQQGHKCLIFTQMSKMLDILEIFLNLHDHSYVRLGMYRY